jgi:hypothetical protein
VFGIAHSTVADSTTSDVECHRKKMACAKPEVVESRVEIIDQAKMSVSLGKHAASYFISGAYKQGF